MGVLDAVHVCECRVCEPCRALSESNGCTRAYSYQRAPLLYCFRHHCVVVVVVVITIRRIALLWCFFLHVFCLSSIPTQFLSIRIPMPYGHSIEIIPSLKLFNVIVGILHTTRLYPQRQQSVESGDCCCRFFTQHYYYH